MFQRTWLYPNEVEEENDSFQGEDFSGLQELVTAMEASCTAEEFLAAEDKIQVCWGLFDPAIQNGKKRQKKKFSKNHERFLWNQHQQIKSNHSH